DVYFFFSTRRRHTRWPRDWSSDVCSSDLEAGSSADDVDAEQGLLEPEDRHDGTRCRPGADQPRARAEDGLDEVVGNPFLGGGLRSEERRVGKECRPRWSTYDLKRKTLATV